MIFLFSGSSKPRFLDGAQLETWTVQAGEDESNACLDYPIENFQTFKDCDAHFVNKQMREAGVMPFWATDNLEEVTAFR